ncbi:MAG: hypothetical protein JJU00_10855 [Opitutales bacterium]|nr:hypothetical protein [Opitutales bacterium]
MLTFLSRPLGILCLVALGAAGLSAKDVEEPRAYPKFGPYEAIAIDADIVKGVRVDDEQRIFLLLAPEMADRELHLRISVERGAGYRKWFTGEEVFVAPPNPDRRRGEWTDWIRTESNFIEYWLDGKLFLHLRRIR